MIKTTIYLNRIGDKYYGRECDYIAQFEMIDEPDDTCIGKVIKENFGFEMKKSKDNCFITDDNRIEVRYHNYKPLITC